MKKGGRKGNRWLIVSEKGSTADTKGEKERKCKRSRKLARKS